MRAKSWILRPGSQRDPNLVRCGTAEECICHIHSPETIPVDSCPYLKSPLVAVLNNSPQTSNLAMSQPFSSIDANIASEVQPLHQGHLSNLELQRQILAKKIAENDGKFASPTDDLMSPCTAKLQANKKRQYMK